MSFLAVARKKKDRSSGASNGGRAPTKQRIFAALDVGSSKVVCFIGVKEVSKTGTPMPVRVLGIGHQICEGLRNGAVVDMFLVEQSIRAAVEAAERMADVHVDAVTVNLSIPGMTSYACSGTLDIDGREVEDGDVERVLSIGCNRAIATGLEVVHAIPVGYRIDQHCNISHPAGMYGKELGVDINLIAMQPGPIRNLRVCIERCHLDVDRFVVSAYASGLASLIEDELDLGVTVIDMGAGTTTVAVFNEGALQFSGVIPFGGQAVTNDIAHGLVTTVEQAERLKAFYGSALGGPNDDKDMIRVPQVGEDDDEDGNRVPRSMLTHIIRPRLEETFEHVRALLDSCPRAQIASRNVVLTGGASQMNGIKELATRVLDKQVRLGRPTKLTGLADATRGPAFTTAAGLLSYTADPPVDVASRSNASSYVPAASRLGRLASWLW